MENKFLLVIDIQEKLLPIVNEAETLLVRVERLLKGWQILNLPLGHTEQYPKGLGSTCSILKPFLKNSFYFEKTTFSAGSSNLIKHLKQNKLLDVYVAGIETHICVYQSIRDLLNENLNVYLITDASSSRKKHDHQIAIQELIRCGANITTIEMLLFEALRDSKHPAFKAISQLIK